MGFNSGFKGLKSTKTQNRWSLGWYWNSGTQEYKI